MSIRDVGPDRAAILEAVRDRLIDEIDVCDSPRDLPALVKQLRDTLVELDSLIAPEVSVVDDLAAKRADRVRDSGVA